MYERRSLPVTTMYSMNTAKLVLAVIGIAVFLIGAQMGNSTVRWTGIGLVAAGFIVRFAGRRTPDRNSTPNDPPENP